MFYGNIDILLINLINHTFVHIENLFQVLYLLYKSWMRLMSRNNRN